MTDIDNRKTPCYPLSIVVELLKKSARQQRRDLLSLGLTLGTAPCFVIVYHLVYGEGEQVGLGEFVPSLLIFAVIMLIFNTAMAVAREREDKTLSRLRRSPMRDSHFLIATGIFQSLIGVASVALTFVVALALGFEPKGSALLGFGVTVVAALACVGLGLVVASLAASVHRAFLIASVLMFLLLLFSGAIFPLPAMEVVTLMGRAVGPLDLLPTVHAVRALQEILLQGSSLRDVLYEVATMTVLSMVFFGLGWSIFRGHQRPTIEMRGGKN